LFFFLSEPSASDQFPQSSSPSFTSFLISTVCFSFCLAPLGLPPTPHSPFPSTPSFFGPPFVLPCPPGVPLLAFGFRFRRPLLHSHLRIVSDSFPTLGPLSAPFAPSGNLSQAPLLYFCRVQNLHFTPFYFTFQLPLFLIGAGPQGPNLFALVIPPLCSTSLVFWSGVVGFPAIFDKPTLFLDEPVFVPRHRVRYFPPLIPCPTFCNSPFFFSLMVVFWGDQFSRWFYPPPNLT